MLCLPFALLAAVLAGYFFAPIAGLLSGSLIFAVCRWLRMRRQSVESSPSTDSSGNSSTSESAFWSGAGGLFGGAGAASGWADSDGAGGDSGGGDGGGD